jgi:hypothetical protein
MAKLGEVAFHPQAAFSENERQEVRRYLKSAVKGLLGYYVAPERHSRGYVIECRDLHGRRVKVDGKLKQVFDFDVSRPLPKSDEPKVLKIRRDQGGSGRSQQPVA